MDGEVAMIEYEMTYRSATPDAEAAIELRIPKDGGHGILRISHSTLAAVTGIRNGTETEMRGALGKVLRGISPRIAHLAAGLRPQEVLELTPEMIRIEVPE
jgi:hypothetical protein